MRTTDAHDRNTFEISGNEDPALPIASLHSMFSCLLDSGLVLSDSIQAMILLAALPCAWDGLAMSILSQYDGDSLTLDDITGIIQNEYSCRLAIQKADSSLAAMITGIKHFGDHDPQWQSQKKQKGGAPKPWQQTPGASGDQ
ncbi:hypothetical protein GGU11DRAFT_694344, partial [Lentinula aff. detonsa]